MSEKTIPAIQTPTFQEIWDTVIYVFNYPVTISPAGGLSISLKSLIIAIVIFVVMYRLSRTAQSLLRRNVLKHLPVDSGLSYTLQRLLHYAIVTLGVLFALNVGVGVNFTSLAVVLTALSVGIGLGLKEIASDVAAGFIILFERPVRVGDRIKLNSDLEGDVQTVDIRTTKIRTNDNLIVIVPNSKLTNEEYVNWSYSNAPVRIHVPVGVAYGSHVPTVREALLKASHDVDGVLQDPAPTVRLVAFGNSSLDFELLVWTPTPEKHPQIKSDLNFNIDDEFRAAGVEIPFPQRDLHLRSYPEELSPANIRGTRTA